MINNLADKIALEKEHVTAAPGGRANLFERSPPQDEPVDLHRRRDAAGRDKGR